MKLFNFLLQRLLGGWYNLSVMFAPSWTGKRLLKIFSTPPRARLRSKEQHFLEQAVIDRYSLKDWGGVVYHWGAPDRPYILLSYGWGYNAGRWRHYVPQLLSANYRVIAYDPPGHGHAAAGTLTLPENAAIIRHILLTFGPPRAILGHSFGGGSLVEALSDLSIYYHPSRMVLMAAFSKASWVFRYFKYTLGLTSYAYRAMVIETERYLGRRLVDFDLALQSSQLSHIRSLFVHDPKDKTTHYRNAIRYHQYWQGSTLLPTPDAGHHLGKPEVTDQILSFIIREKIPETALEPVPTLSPNHDLVRFFAGMETGLVETPIRIP